MMKIPKNLDPGLWEEFQTFVKDRDVEIKDEGVLHLMWDSWYDGYCFGIPRDRDVNVAAVEAANKKSLLTDTWKCTECSANGTGQGWVEHRHETGHYTVTMRV